MVLIFTLQTNAFVEQQFATPALAVNRQTHMLVSCQGPSHHSVTAALDFRLFAM
jgi:hypothetical protein